MRPASKRTQARARGPRLSNWRWLRRTAVQHWPDVGTWFHWPVRTQSKTVPKLGTRTHAKHCVTFRCLRQAGTENVPSFFRAVTRIPDQGSTTGQRAVQQQLAKGMAQGNQKRLAGNAQAQPWMLLRVLTRTAAATNPSVTSMQSARSSEVPTNPLQSYLALRSGARRQDTQIYFPVSSRVSKAV